MKENKTRFVLCIDNRDCEDLEKGKVYRILPDKAAAEESFVRVTDESGEDYLYPKSYFVPVEIPRRAERALLAEKISALETVDYLAKRAKRGSRRAFDRAMSKVSDREPEKRGRI
jgi:hypothetical protein